MRIGVFGGSFNPPHKMHKNIALNLVKNNYIDKVVYVPTGNKYEKKNLIDAKYRYNMLKLMIKDYDYLELSNYEIQSTLINTYQTLDYFKKLYPNEEIYFICGIDNLKELTTWENYEYILDNYKIIVIERDNEDVDGVLRSINSRNIINAIIDLDNISSTYIRSNINNEGVILGKLDCDVLDYIRYNNLYQ